MEINTLTLPELIANYQSFLEENLTGKEITKIADRIQKNPRTIYNYLNSEAKFAVDYLTMKAIVENGIKLLEERNISISI